MSDATNDIRNPATQNQLAQNEGTQTNEHQLAMNAFERAGARTFFQGDIRGAKDSIGKFTGGVLSSDDIDNITDQILHNAEISDLKSLQGANPNALTQPQFDIINREVEKLTGPEGERAKQAWQDAQNQGKVCVQQTP